MTPAVLAPSTNGWSLRVFIGPKISEINWSGPVALIPWMWIGKTP